MLSKVCRCLLISNLSLNGVIGCEFDIKMCEFVHNRSTCQRTLNAQFAAGLCASLPTSRCLVMLVLTVNVESSVK